MTIKEIRSRRGLSFRVISGEHDEVKRPLSQPTSEDSQGPVALMLCESILHLLVERGVITKATAIEAIETVGDATREMANDAPTIANRAAADLVTAILKSFELKA